jgi:hypothetical protein
MMSREAVEAYLNVLSTHSPGDTEVHCDGSQVVVRPRFEPQISRTQFRNSTACARVLSVMSSCTGERLTACS